MRSLMDLIHCKFGALYDQNYKNLSFQKSTTNRFEKEFSFPVIRAIPRNVQRYYLLAADITILVIFDDRLRGSSQSLCV